jgi:hypothetical protein
MFTVPAGNTFEMAWMDGVMNGPHSYTVAMGLGVCQ